MSCFECSAFDGHHVTGDIGELFGQNLRREAMRQRQRN